MGQIRPVLSEEELAGVAKHSNAEALFYRACVQQLPARISVLHSIEWVRPDSRGTPKDGEADFVILDPQNGILVVEIKGGGIEHNARTGTWTSTNASGCHRIKDPFVQARKEKYAILGMLRDHQAWLRHGPGRINLGHAVFVPDVYDIAPLSSPGRPKEMIGGSRELKRLKHWVDSAFRYWEGSSGEYSALTETGVQLAIQALAGSPSVRPIVKLRLEYEETERLKLTRQQARALNLLGGRRRAAICGGAGTGKTVLAFEKAAQLAASGLTTLLLCYNRPLADHLQTICHNHSNLRAMNFHQLCDWRGRMVRTRTGRDLFAEARAQHPGADQFEVHMPLVLGFSLEEIDDTYDAIIVDEAQDFAPEYWDLIEMMLRDVQDSYLYIFYDQNQEVYRDNVVYPVADTPYVLTVNCRNTARIHDVVYKFFRGDATEPCEIDGLPIQHLIADDVIAQSKQIALEVVRLIDVEKVPARSIAILIAHGSFEQLSAELATHRLPHGLKWAMKSPGNHNSVVVETIGRFKGLESNVVFLWGLGDLANNAKPAYAYVGTSRAKSILYLVGDTSECEAIIGSALGERDLS